MSLHPTPIDRSLFEDPHEINTVDAKGIGSSTSEYVAPSPSTVVTSLLPNRESPRMSKSQLLQARATLDQFKALHNGNEAELGDPSVDYFRAAYAAFTFGQPQEAVQWIFDGPNYNFLSSTSQRDEGRDILCLILAMLKPRASKSPRSLRAGVVAIIAKGWHANESVASKLAGAIRDLLHVHSRPGEISELWDQMWQAAEEPAATALREDDRQRQQSRRTLLTKAFNYAVRQLALAASRREEAVALVQRNLSLAQTTDVPKDAKEIPWLAPHLTAFTYQMLLQQLLSSGNNRHTLLAHSLNMQIGTASKVLPPLPAGEHRPRDKTASPVQSWSGQQANYLFVRGRQVLVRSMGKESQATGSQSVDQEDVSARAAELCRSLSDTHIIQLVRSGRTNDARAAILERINSSSQLPPDEYSHLIGPECLAGFQAALALETGGAAGDTIRLPQDRQIEGAFRQARAGKGLWEMAHLWRLRKERRFVTALEYYLSTWHQSPDLSSELIYEAIRRPQAQHNEGGLNVEEHDHPARSGAEALLWPSSHTLHLVAQILVSQIRSGGNIASESASRKERSAIVLESLQRLEKSWQTWYSNILQQKLEGALEDRRLTSYGFDPWLAAFSSEHEKLEGLAGGLAQQLSLEAPQPDVLQLLDSLDLLKGLNMTRADNVQVSGAVARALQLMQDMQNVGVSPNEATLNILVDTLARDSIGPMVNSVAGTGVQQGRDFHPGTVVPSTSWSIILHLAHRMGMTPNSSSEPRDREHALPQASLNTYAALLRGISAIPHRKGGSSPVALERAREVHRWLLAALQPADVDDGTEAKYTVEEVHQHVHLQRQLRELAEWAKSESSIVDG